MITVRGVTKTYRTRVLDEMDCDFPTGSVTYLMGANGTGKTTLFKCLLGLESYDGEIRFAGKPLAQVRDQVMAVFDDTPCYPHLSGWANLRLLVDGVDVSGAPALMGGSDPESLLRRRVRSYSSGQRKRLAMTAARLLRPRYLILDEVASGLDLESMDVVVAAIQDMAADCVVIATGHQFDFYGRVADRVLVLTSGRMEEVSGNGDHRGDLEQVYRRYVLAAAG